MPERSEGFETRLYRQTSRTPHFRGRCLLLLRVLLPSTKLRRRQRPNNFVETLGRKGARCCARDCGGVKDCKEICQWRRRKVQVGTIYCNIQVQKVSRNLYSAESVNCSARHLYTYDGWGNIQRNLGVRETCRPNDTKSIALLNPETSEQ